MAEAMAAETARSAKVASMLAAVTERTYRPSLVDVLAQQFRGIDLLAQRPSTIDVLAQQLALDRVDRLPRPRSPIAESAAQPSAEPDAPGTSATDQLIAELRDEVCRLAAEVSRLSAGGDVRRVLVTLLAAFSVVTCLFVVLYLSDPRLYSEINVILGPPLAVYGIVAALILGRAGPR